MKSKGFTLVLAVCVLLAVPIGGLAQPKMLTVDGALWKTLPQGEKMAYITGVGNMASFETAMGGSGRAACISKAFVDELKDKTIDKIVAEVDAFYQEKPDRLRTPVIEVVLQRCTALCPPEIGAPEKSK